MVSSYPPSDSSPGNQLPLHGIPYHTQPIPMFANLGISAFDAARPLIISDWVTPDKIWQRMDLALALTEVPPAARVTAAKLASIGWAGRTTLKDLAQRCRQATPNTKRDLNKLEAEGILNWRRRKGQRNTNGNRDAEFDFAFTGKGLLEADAECNPPEVGAATPPTRDFPNYQIDNLATPPNYQIDNLEPYIKMTEGPRDPVDQRQTSSQEEAEQKNENSANPPDWIAPLKPFYTAAELAEIADSVANYFPRNVNDYAHAARQVVRVYSDGDTLAVVDPVALLDKIASNPRKANKQSAKKKEDARIAEENRERDKRTNAYHKARKEALIAGQTPPTYEDFFGLWNPRDDD